ncbi:MAG: hypothetical protein NDI94_02445, partial [Candidatus Woesearchaeota archaeon]|nr:hypothetical protein [Candidatus Woesearchaeota archaeon]
MKNAIIGIAAIFVALVVLISAKNMLSGNVPNPAGNDNPINNAEVPVNIGNAPSINENGEQEVILKYVNYKYEMYPSTLRKGIPVRLEVDL